MRALVLFAALGLVSLTLWPVKAAPSCRRPLGQCVCTASPDAKSQIGYGSDQSVPVTCIDMKTMDVAYFRVPRAQMTVWEAGK